MPVALHHLLALDARVESCGDAGVDRRTTECARDELGDHPGEGFGGYFRGCCPNALADNKFDAGDGCRSLDGSAPVDPCRRGQRDQSRRQRGKIRDEHLFGELDFGRHIVDRVRQLA